MSERRLLSLAVRNLGRNRRRTFLTALAVFSGTCAVLFLEGWVNGFCRYLVENVALARFGPILVVPRGSFETDDPLGRSMPDRPEFAARLLAVPGVSAGAPRIRFDGLLSNGSESALFIATAIEPAEEYKVCPKRAQRVAPGSQPLAPQPGRDAVGRALLGKTLATALGAGIGSTLIMQAQGRYGSTNALDVAVSGLLPLGSLTESKRLATVPLRFAQRLLRMDGQVSEYGVGVAELDEVDAVAARLRGVLSPELEVRTWRELDPVSEQRAATLRYLLRLVSGVLFLLVGIGIANAMLMSVYERVREIGTMLSLGVRRWQVAVLFLYEAGVLTLLSAITGSATGALGVRMLGRYGIQAHLPGGEILVLRPYVGSAFLGLVVLVALLGAVLSASYPAWQAARMHPAVALRST